MRPEGAAARCRALVPTGGVAHIGKHLKTLRQKCPTSVPLMLLMGHYQMSQVTLTLQPYNPNLKP